MALPLGLLEWRIDGARVTQGWGDRSSCDRSTCGTLNRTSLALTPRHPSGIQAALSASARCSAITPPPSFPSNHPALPGRRLSVEGYASEQMRGLAQLDVVRVALAQAEDDWPALLARLERIRVCRAPPPSCPLAALADPCVSGSFLQPTTVPLSPSPPPPLRPGDGAGLARRRGKPLGRPRLDADRRRPRPRPPRHPPPARPCRGGGRCCLGGAPGGRWRDANLRRARVEQQGGRPPPSPLSFRRGDSRPRWAQWQRCGGFDSRPRWTQWQRCGGATVDQGGPSGSVLEGATVDQGGPSGSVMEGATVDQGGPSGSVMEGATVDQGGRQSTKVGPVAAL